MREVVSDRGSVFRSRLVQGTITAFGARSCFTSPLHPQSDGLVERFNRTLEQMLSMYVRGDQADWCTYLPMVCYAYNTSVQASTGCSPHVLLYGREPRFQSDAGVNINHPTWSDDVQGRVEVLQGIVRKAVDHIRRAQQRQKRCHDRRSSNTQYIDGDLVMLFAPRRITGRSKKLSRLYKGPYRVVRQTSPVNYKIVSLETGRESVVHVSRLKRYYNRVVV